MTPYDTNPNPAYTGAELAALRQNTPPEDRTPHQTWHLDNAQEAARQADESRAAKWRTAGSALVAIAMTATTIGQTMDPEGHAGSYLAEHPGANHLTWAGIGILALSGVAAIAKGIYHSRRASLRS